MTREDGLAFLRDLQNANAVIFDEQPDGALVDHDGDATTETVEQPHGDRDDLPDL